MGNLRKLEKEAESGDARSITSLADAYYNGGRSSKRKLAKALRLYSNACSDSPQAMLGLGMMYYNGDCVCKDRSKAFEFFEEAADNGNPRAMLMAGLMLIDGRGIARNPEKGRDLIVKSASAGDELASLLRSSHVFLDKLMHDGEVGRITYEQHRSINSRIYQINDACKKIDDQRKIIHDCEEKIRAGDLSGYETYYGMERAMREEIAKSEEKIRKIKIPSGNVGVLSVESKNWHAIASIVDRGATRHEDRKGWWIPWVLWLLIGAGVVRCTMSCFK